MSRARSGIRRWLWIAVAVAVVIWFIPAILSAMGRFLVAEDRPVKADAVVVLSTGIEIYPRWIEAARLYRDGFVAKVVVNGNRKSAALRGLEAQGLLHPCGWDAEARAVLSLLAVSQGDIIGVSAEDAFDTISEARSVALALKAQALRRVMITTSRFHTRRAGRIWREILGDASVVAIVAARDDPFDSRNWWRKPRQIRWVLAEYGGWILYWWDRWRN